MPYQTKLHQLFYGGIATDRKVGLEYSHGYSRALDFRKRPGRLSVLPGAREIGNQNVVDLIQHIVQVDDGDRYAYGDRGFFYKIDVNNAVTPIVQLDNSAAGMLYRRDMDELYLTHQRTMSRFGKFSTTTPEPVIAPNKYGPTRSESDTALKEGGGETFSLKTSIDEGDKIQFTPDIEPLYSFKINLLTKGTGDWTLTMHDDADNELGAVILTNANLPSQAGLAEFVFDEQVRMLVSPNARTYHMHLTSTVADGTIQCSTKGDMTSSDFEMWADRLVIPNNGLHPMAQFLQYTIVGNERYLAVWEPLADQPNNLEFNRHRLTFPPGYEVCGMAANDEYLCIAAEQRSTDDSRSYQYGKLFFWNGLDTTYEFYIDIPEGSPQSVFTYQNTVYMIIAGSLYCWPGGKNIVKLRTIEFADSEYTDAQDTTDVYPHMMAARRNILLFGYPSYTTNESLEYGIRSWGQRDKDFPMSLGLNYSISTNTRFNTEGNLYLGGIWSFGDTLYISWRDGTDYGIDVVDNSSDPAPEAVWESMEFDGGEPTHEKQAIALVLQFPDDIPTGYRLRPKVRYNWSSTWEYGEDLTAANKYIMDLSARFYVAEYGFDVINQSATEPLQEVGVKFVYNDNVNEIPWGK